MDVPEVDSCDEDNDVPALDNYFEVVEQVEQLYYYYYSSSDDVYKN